ncbi:metallophosphoesterase family protein [Microvirga massiliensis]|uniref:metallophosphoesterase family protein n=1 Tax=Microvirga massiliensis TaxID=1033741 RepID=UPI00062B4199|nr:metallophosphoesterase family protein [Microvirga massiliensis]
MLSKLLRKAAPTPPLPFAVEDGTRIYAVGDIHGRADLLAEMIDRIRVDMDRCSAHRLVTVFLGDYVDRGPDSRLVVDMLLALSQGGNAICLKGNHEAILVRFLREPILWENWVALGGLQTLLSYGLRVPARLSREDQVRVAEEFRQALPAEHLYFLESLPLTHVSGNVAFVHAGLRPTVPLDRQQEEDLLWIRQPFLDHRDPFSHFVVHGHTPVESPEVHANRINIDTGAFATGRLSCIALQGNSHTFL